MSVNKLSNTRKPEEISLDEWQTGLRKQFATDQNFKFINMGDHPVYSDFEVLNPETEKRYKVSIRDNVKSYNFCSCPDFKINGLGTCKHIENMLYYFSRYKKYRKYLGKPYIPKYSSLSIFYGNERKVWLKKAVNAAPVPGEKNIFDNGGFLISGKLPELPAFIDLALKNEPGFRVYPDVFEKIELDRKNRERDQITRKLFIRGTESQLHFVRGRRQPDQHQRQPQEQREDDPGHRRRPGRRQEGPRDRLIVVHGDPEPSGYDGGGSEPPGANDRRDAANSFLISTSSS